jgi:hypothetical protein
MFLFYLSNVQICYMKSIVLLHPFLNFLVCSLRLSTCSINLIQINLYLNMIIWLLLGQKNNRLDVVLVEQHLNESANIYLLSLSIFTFSTIISQKVCL